MFPWLDLALMAYIIWETMAGYLYGPVKAGLRGLAAITALLLPLPFAVNCAMYIRPFTEKVFSTALGEREIAVSSGVPSIGSLGKWDEVLDFPAGPGTVYLENILRLAVNVSGLVFLGGVIYLIFKVVERLNSSGQQITLGALLGFVNGVITVAVFLALAPVMALAEKGVLFSTALEASAVARVLGPVVHGIIMIIAPFLY